MKKEKQNEAEELNAKNTNTNVIIYIIKIFLIQSDPKKKKTKNYK